MKKTPNSPATVNDDQLLLVVKIMKEIAPLECASAGDFVVSRIARNLAFQDLTHGKHIDLRGTIEYLNTIAGLAQALILAGVWIDNKIKKRSQQDDLKAVIASLEAKNHVEVIALLRKNTDIMEKIMLSQSLFDANKAPPADDPIVKDHIG